jgi:hypothetical protein
MSQVSFQCEKKALLESIKRLRQLFNPEARKSAPVEIRIQPQFVSLHVNGGMEKIFCVSNGWGSFTVLLEYLNALVRETDGKAFSPSFINGEMHVGGVITSGLGFKIYQTHLENKQTPDLPVNYSDVDVLKLRNDILFMGSPASEARRLIMSAEHTLNKNIRQAHIFLKQYGVTIEDLEELVGKKI